MSDRELLNKAKSLIKQADKEIQAKQEFKSTVRLAEFLQTCDPLELKIIHAMIENYWERHGK